MTAPYSPGRGQRHGTTQNGDIVVGCARSDAETGDNVAAMIASVKCLKRTGHGVWQIPKNQASQSIPSDTATLLGKVAAALPSCNHTSPHWRADPEDAKSGAVPAAASGVSRRSRAGSADR